MNKIISQYLRKDYYNLTKKGTLSLDRKKVGMVGAVKIDGNLYIGYCLVNVKSGDTFDLAYAKNRILETLQNPAKIMESKNTPKTIKNLIKDDFIYRCNRYYKTSYDFN
jgi:hypothetical protein